jgi:hypothetical protein
MLLAFGFRALLVDSFAERRESAKTSHSAKIPAEAGCSLRRFMWPTFQLNPTCMKVDLWSHFRNRIPIC